jgi:SAM-dependent methyltransferase
MEEVNEGILRQFPALGLPAGRVLDVGCGRGQLGEAIRALGWEVWGVENSEEACRTARGRIDRLIEADLHDYAAVAREVGETRFDALVFSDVLEHVYDPRTVLEAYARFLKPGARVLISVPNAVVWTNRLQWTFGRVRYADTGVMDRTHVRFFTFRTARELVEASGFRLERTDSTPFLVRALLPVLKRFSKPAASETPPDPRAMIDSAGYRLYMKRVYPMEKAVASLWKGMLAFRIIVVGRTP